jgi:syntaxin-binding protein 5
MASFIRGKQSGMAKDLSATLVPGSFLPGEQSRYGIGSQISCATHEPVQSILAVGTHSSKFGPATIYVFGQARIQKRLIPSEGRGSAAGYGGSGSGASIVALQFVANRLIALDSRSELTIWDLDKAVMVARYIAPGSGVIRLVTDPMLDWAFLGLTTGEVVAYDLDRMSPAPWRIPNFWTKTRDQRARGVGLVSLQLHPRDIGQLLIGYTHGAVVYSFKQNQVLKYFEYILPPGAPGGNGGVSGEGLESLRRPRLTQALWHPTGTFVLTAHEDGSLVFWDPKDGRVVMARSLSDVDVDKPRANPGKPLLLDPFARIAWCCKENPDDTALLIAGGQAADAQEKNLTFLELGPTPIYATSTWQVLTDHFRGKRQLSLPIPLGAQVVDFSLIPRSSPHFAAAQDPIAILAILSSGELVTLSFPSGYQISPTNQLHPSLSFVQPFIARTTISTLDRNRWLGMVEKRQNGELLVKGGAESVKPRRRYEGRNIVQAAHVDGTIRIWDLGHGDEMENATQLQIDAARALGRYDDVQVTAMDLADSTGEFAAGLLSGEVVVWRWGGNKYFQREGAQPERISNPGGLSDISANTEPALQEGLQPFVLYEMMQGAISVVTVSDVGFVAVGSENGFFSMIDLRGPAVIFDASMADFAKQEKRSSFIKGHSSSGSSGAKEWPVVIEFGVMTLDEDKYSSIACFVGTNQGRLITFKLLPSGSSYAVKFAGVTSLADRIVAICPIVADTGKPASATGAVVAGLRTGQQVNGLLVVGEFHSSLFAILEIY